MTSHIKYGLISNYFMFCGSLSENNDGLSLDNFTVSNSTIFIIVSSWLHHHLKHIYTYRLQEPWYSLQNYRSLLVIYTYITYIIYRGASLQHSFNRNDMIIPRMISRCSIKQSSELVYASTPLLQNLHQATVHIIFEWPP